ncbi:MAG: glycoside hydrolase family 9 protein, partial [Lutimonas sp.]
MTFKRFFYLTLLSLLFIQCESEKLPLETSNSIRLNQIGYYPGSVKEFVLVDQTAGSFRITDDQGEVVFKGELLDRGIWDTSGEQVMTGDFSDLITPGTYTIEIDSVGASYPFSIEKKLYEKALNASIKSYYFQRASMPIEEAYGGIYKRAAGHPDTACVYHPSSKHKKGQLNSTGGWYDAGDYGKYIVNAALSTGQMLHLLEQYPDAIPDATLNIPESGNEQSDLWDELLFELNWISTMQDRDGGVYHKLTAKNFSGFIMPEAYDLERFVIGKGTAATLGYAAVMAQAGRLYTTTDPVWSAEAIISAEKAWKWALRNKNVPFSNPEDVSTGQYDDTIFSDDFYWAAAELYVATGEKKYLRYLEKNPQTYQHELTNSWKFFVRNNAFHSLLENRDKLPQKMADDLVSDHLKLADSLLVKIDRNPYHVALDRYEWGSNSDVLNQAMILCVAHRLSGEEKYLTGAERINDYIFGKNATGYCFFTGFGSKRVMFPHHRPSGADGIADPVPGFVIGGPNHDRQDQHEVDYDSEFPAKAYMDVEPSFASNEVCINWNAPAVFVLSYL